MAINPFKWEAAFSSVTLFTSGAALASTELTVESAAYAGNTALNSYGWFEIDTATWTVAPSDAHPILVAYRRSNPGTSYVDAPVAGGAQQGQMVATTIPIRKVTGAQRILSPPFELYSVAQTFYLENQTGQNLSAGWNLTLWVANKATHTP